MPEAVNIAITVAVFIIVFWGAYLLLRGKDPK